MPRLTMALMTAIVSSLPAPVTAQPPSPWAAALESEDARVTARLLESAMTLIACATDPAQCEGTPPPDAVLWAQAAIRLERAAARAPSDDDVGFLHAVARSNALAADASREELEQVIALYEGLRERSPGYAPSNVAFELAILRTRAGDMAGAANEYERASRMVGLGPTPPSHTLAMWEALLASWHAPVTPSSMYGNWAEVTMLAGDAARASELYGLAMAAVPAASFSGALARWGLALARDRAGAHDGAVEMACQAIDVGLPSESGAVEASREATRARFGPFAALHDAGVFFEPREEIRAYEALGHECLARRSASAEGRRLQLERARASWRSFLVEGGAEGVWAEAGTAALAIVEAQLGTAER